MPAFSRFLRYFMAVGRHGSIRKAADELSISPSAIDRQILNVETDLGMPLFERLPTGLRLTAAGEIMMAAGARWQMNMAEVRAQMEDLRGLKRGHVEIAVVDALAEGYLPRALADIRVRYPGVTLGIRVMDHDKVRAAIAEAAVDFGILFEPESYRDLHVRAFVKVPLGFVSPPGHRLAGFDDVRFSACADLPLILPAMPLMVSQQIAVLEGVTGLQAERVATCDNIQMIASLVREGMGIAILSAIDVATAVEQGQLCFTRISDPVLRPLTLALCTATGRTPSYAADILLGEIEGSFTRLGEAPNV